MSTEMTEQMDEHVIEWRVSEGEAFAARIAQLCKPDYACRYKGERGWLDNVYLVLAGAFIGLILFGMLRSAGAQGVTLQGPNGEYLGNLNSNHFDPNSVANPFGRYGSQFSQDSINNPFSRWGSPYSSDSPNNPYATGPLTAPQIRAPRLGY